MIPWELIDSAPLPGRVDGLCLFKRGSEYSIRMGGREVMGSRTHGSEDALAELACERIADRVRPRILVGGLGLGFTTAAALARIGPKGRVVVAELVPTVVRWVRGPLAHLAGDPLRDTRVTVREEDIVTVLRSERRFWDAILLDVDNGPEDLINRRNDRLYDQGGLEVIRAALRPGGVLAVWSAGPDRPFVHRLEKAGYLVNEVRVRSRGDLGGRRHIVWLAAVRESARSFAPSGRRGQSGINQKIQKKGMKKSTRQP